MIVVTASLFSMHLILISFIRLVLGLAALFLFSVYSPSLKESSA